MQSVTGGNHEIHERHETPSQSALLPTALPKGEPRTHTGFAVATKKHPPLRRHPLCERGQGACNYKSP